MNNKLDQQYLSLLRTLMDYGVKKQTRNGEVLSVFGYTVRHKMSDGFPLLTTKKMAWKQIVTELVWFLRGDTNIKYLIDNGCYIWNGDAIKNYEKHNGEIDWGKYITKEEAFVIAMEDEDFAKKWGELGPIYGKQWRRWTKKKMWLSTDGSYEKIYDEADQTVIDQIAGLINELKTNPDSRRMLVSAWNVGELDQMVLPPCHYGFQVYTRELSLKERCDAYMKWSNDPKCVEWKNHIENEMGWDYEKPDWVFKEVREQLDKAQFPTRAISLMWNQRSVDTFLGLPFNIASYGLLLEILAKLVNMVPDELIGNLGDTHLYFNHVEQAVEQITREPYDLPKLKMNPIFLANLEHKGFEAAINGDINFELDGYKCHPQIKAPLSN